jgi:hypothetical protein
VPPYLYPRELRLILTLLPIPELDLH